MAVQPLKLPYTIQNGKFKGQTKIATIQISDGGTPKWRIGLDSAFDGADVLGHSILAITLIKRAIAAKKAQAILQAKNVALNPSLPAVGTGSLEEGEEEIEVAVGENGPAEAASETSSLLDTTVQEAARELVADDILAAEAAAAIAPGSGLVVAAGLLALGGIIAGGLTVYDIIESSPDPLVSVVFINGIPNSQFGFTSVNTTSGMKMVGPDTDQSMLAEKAKSTLTDAGALQYTWQAPGAAPGGNASIEFSFDSGTKATASLVWSFYPKNDQHACELNPITGGNLLKAMCWKQSVKKNEKNHLVLLYLILPSHEGAEKVSLTTDPAKPLIQDTLWAKGDIVFTFGIDNRGTHPTRYAPAAVFNTGDQAYHLRDITLPLGHRTGSKGATVSVSTSKNNKPDQVLETIQVLEFETGKTVVQSVAKPLLNANTDYFITVSAPDGADFALGAWSGSNFLQNPLVPDAKNYFLFAVGGDPVAV